MCAGCTPAWYLQRPEEDSLELELHRWLCATMRVLELDPSLLHEQPVPGITALSFQPVFCCSFWFLFSWVLFCFEVFFFFFKQLLFIERPEHKVKLGLQKKAGTFLRLCSDS